MTIKLRPEQAEAIVNALNEAFDANVSQSQASAPNEINTWTKDLSVAVERSAAISVSFPFTSIYVEDATDSQTYVRCIPYSNDSSQQDVMLKKNDTFQFDRGVSKVFLYWPAQAGKKIVIKFFVSSKFTSGSTINDDVSVPVTVGAGYATGEMDGFTREVSLVYDIGGNTYSSLDIRDPQNNTASAVTINTVARTGYIIPAGYYAEVMGLSLKIRTATTATSFINLYAIVAGETITEATQPQTNRIGYVFADTDAAGTYDVRVLNTAVAGEKGYVRRGIIINAGECLFMLADGATPTAGDAVAYALIRLRPIVGT